MSNVNAFCSWCYNKCEHLLIKNNKLSRNIYECTTCRNTTLICRYCEEMSKGTLNHSVLSGQKLSKISKLSKSWSNELCAEHDGTVASFSNLTMKIADISDYEKIFKREKRNLLRTGKTAGYVGVGVVGVLGVAATAGTGVGPFAVAMGKLGLLGAAGTGTAISSLSGAALTSASLAAIGGSVAAGTAIISATGLALGGTIGGVVANKYYAEDKSFAIRKLRTKESTSNTIFINGFTQENQTDFLDWQCSQLSFDSSHTMYGVNWSSKTNAQLGLAFGKGVGTKIAKSALVKLGKAGGKAAARKLNPLGWVTLIADLAANPWHNSMMRAAQAGIQLAEAISRTDGKKFNLVGHSLGCRVIYYALEALSSKKDKYINDVILLGGAVGRKDTEGWLRAISAIDGQLFNCHSKQDMVLFGIYQTANAGLSSPIGINPIEMDHHQLTNINCDDLVESHMTWKNHYETILNKIYG